MNGPLSFLLNIAVAVIATGATVAAFYGANRATRLKATTDNRAVDAAAYSRATDIYESTITALRAEVARLTTDIQAARQEIREVRTELSELRTANDHLVAELAHLRSQEHDELTVLRERETGRLSAYDDQDQPPALHSPREGSPVETGRVCIA